ncbi:MAG: hypothetical protein CMJ36_03615 [Phycisphaerae bacterium]|nr:hypothetical protein [Phycisphaerae bacterium]
MNPVLIEQLVMYGVALLAGLVLWGMGGRLLRPALGLVGVVIGGAIGWICWSLVENLVPLWALVGGTALLIGCIGMLVYRLLLAGLLSLLLAIGCMVGAWCFMDQGELTPVPLATLSEIVAGASVLEQVTPAFSDSSSSTSMASALANHADAVRTEILDRVGILHAAWLLLSPLGQLVVIGSIIGGLFSGLLLATFTPRFSAIFLTASLGSLLILGTLVRVVTMTGASLTDAILTWTPLPLVLWAALAFIGMCIQFTMQARRGAEAD